MDIDRYLRKGIKGLKPYIPGKSEEEIRETYHPPEVVKLASNENPSSPPGAVIEAIQQEAIHVNRYPDGKCRNLAPKLASFLGCNPDELIFGNGAEELILMVCQAFLNEGETCVIVSNTFDAYETAVRIMGGVPVFSPLDSQYRINLDDVAGRITPDTKLIFLPNPNNPTGTIFTRSEFEKFLRHLPEKAFLVLDEAYHEYVNDPDYPDSIEYIKKGVPLLVLRTFSKAYGLAGLRIGYAVSHPSVIELLHHVRLPFNVNRLAEAAASAALDQQVWVQKRITEINEEKAFIYKALRGMKLFFIPSHTNFIFINVQCDAEHLFRNLLHQGIIVRQGSIWGFKTFIRLTVGNHRENERFLTALKKMISS